MAADGSAARGRGLLWLGVAFAVAGAVVDFLWYARRPGAGEGVVFAVRRAGLVVKLSAGQFAAFATAVFAAALASVIVAFLLARHAVRIAECGMGKAECSETPNPQLPTPSTACRAAWRWVVALAALVVCAVPTYMLLGWADGRLSAFRHYDAAWYRASFFRELGLVSAARLFWLGGVVALGGYGLTRPWGGLAVSRLLGAVERVPRWVLVAGASGLVTVLALAVALGMLRGEPHYNDANGCYYQAKTFAAGRLWSPLVGGREFFDPNMCPHPAGVGFAFVGDRWFFVLPPLAPLLYALGMLAGAPWVVAPLLGGGVVAASYWLAREIFGGTVALIALPLTALSGWLVFNSAEYLTHVPCLVAMLVFMVAALRAMRTGSWAWGAGAGLLLGLGAAARPATALALCLPFAVAWAVWLLRRPREAWLPTVAFAVALAVPLACLVAYNAATTGEALTSPYQALWRNPAPRGENPELVAGWRWRPVVGVANFLESAFRFDAALYHWPVPALGVIVGALLLAGKKTPGVFFLGFAGLALALVHTRWGNVSVGMSGPRYVFEALPLGAILGAAGLVALHERFVAKGFPAERVRAVLFLVLAGLFAYGTLFTLARELPGYRNLHAVDVRVFDAVKARAARPALVFVPVPPSRDFTNKFIAAIARNDPGLSGPIIYARDLGEKNAKLMRALPGRHCYRWDYGKFALEPLEVRE